MRSYLMFKAHVNKSRDLEAMKTAIGTEMTLKFLKIVQKVNKIVQGEKNSPAIEYNFLKNQLKVKTGMFMVYEYQTFFSYDVLFYFYDFLKYVPLCCRTLYKNEASLGHILPSKKII